MTQYICTKITYKNSIIYRYPDIPISFKILVEQQRRISCDGHKIRTFMICTEIVCTICTVTECFLIFNYQFLINCCFRLRLSE